MPTQKETANIYTMQKHHSLNFVCHSCESPVSFSLFHLRQEKGHVSCPCCTLTYDFGDETLIRQLGKFEDLCKQIQLSEEILSNTSIGVYVGEKEVKIPYKILLSRLNSKLELSLNGRPLTIIFRFEPLKDLPPKE